MSIGSRARAGIGIAALIGVIAIAFVFTGNHDVTTTSAEAPPASSAAPAPAPDLPDQGLHPELLDIEGWLNTDVSSLEELRGDVVAVQFWTFGCSNCKATLPHMQELYQRYHDQGFEIVGIHAPEFDDGTLASHLPPRSRRPHPVRPHR